MESATFRRWLAQRGCRFDEPAPERRGHGHGTITIQRDGRTAELPLLGSRKPIAPETARAICAALDLDWTELPGPKSRA